MAVPEATTEELIALYRILGGTADATGERFFKELARHMAEALGVQYALVSEFTNDATRMRIRAFWDGRQFQDIGEYDVRPTPCSQVIGGHVFHCARDVQKRFPHDMHLKAIGAESYRGVPMTGPSGKHLGHVAAVHTEPIVEEARFVTIMQLFAVRAAAELERVHVEEALEASERRLHTVLQSAMDAIVTIDCNGTVTFINAAGERIFRCRSNQVLGKSIKPFLSEGLTERLAQYIEKAAARPDNEGEYFWLPHGLHAKRHRGQLFSIEGTISRVRLDGWDHFTMVLRDINERQETAKSLRRLLQEKSALVDELKQAHHVDEIIGHSPAFLDAMRQCELVAPTEAGVLILGESGTGKELMARAIHAGSQRADKPLVKVDCAALPDNLIESELFGHEKGSFTGAVQRRIGKLEVADGGTFFLDEIGELPLPLQPKLLRALQDKEFERVGGNEVLPLNIRVIAATNRNLEDMVQAGEFREDLYYRLNVFPLAMPPLRERPEDILLLAHFFLTRVTRKMGRAVSGISDEAKQRLLAYPWPGNVRELENVIERSVILCTGSELEISDASLPRPNAGQDVRSQDGAPAALEDVEREHIRKILDRAGGVVDGPRGAARILRMNPSTLRSRMRKLGIAKMATR